MKPYELTEEEIIRVWEAYNCIIDDKEVGFSIDVAHEAQKKLLEYIINKDFIDDFIMTDDECFQSLLKDFGL